MEYCVTGKSQSTNEIADKEISNMIQEYSRQLFGFTRAEFDLLTEYDILNIFAFFYTKMNAQQKMHILEMIQDHLKLADLEGTIENLALFSDDELYIPFSCRMVDHISDHRITEIVFQTLFK